MKIEQKELVEIKSGVLKSARIAKGMNQDELAKAVFTTRQSISSWENGRRIPTLDSINRLADILEIPIDDLIIRKVGDDLSTNEKRLETDTNSYCMVYPTIVSRKAIKELKLIKIILVVILVLLIFYLICSIRKFYILTDIRNKMLEYENVENYHLTINYYEIIDGKYTNFYVEDIYYLNGMVKREFEYQSEELYQKESSYINENKKIIIDYENKTYEIVDFDYIYDDFIAETAFSNEIKSGLLNLIRNTFNPFFRISSYINYNLNYIYKESNKKLKIDERINKTTGLLEEQIIQTTDGNNYIKRQIEFSSNAVTYDNIKIPALDGYVEK